MGRTCNTDVKMRSAYRMLFEKFKAADHKKLGREEVYYIQVAQDSIQ
jgi:hypothetical protein